MRHYPLKNHNGSVHYNAKVYCAKAHKVGRDAKYAHKNKAKEHCKRNNGGYNKSGPKVAKEDYEHQKDNECALYEVAQHCGDIAFHQLRPVQVGLYLNPFGKHLLHLLHPLLQLFGNKVGIGSFKHHCNTSHALSLAIHCHSAKTLWSTKAHLTNVAYVYRYAATVGYYNLFYIRYLSYHTFGPYIVSPVGLLYITAACVLIILGESLKDICYCNVKGVERIWVQRHLVLFEEPAKTIYLHYAGYSGELPPHNPILNGAQLHCIVLLLVARLHL